MEKNSEGTTYLQSHPEITEILIDYIETSSDALEVLDRHNYPKIKAYENIAKCLKECVIPIPDGFPCSAACHQYGRAIAEHILKTSPCKH